MTTHKETEVKVSLNRGKFGGRSEVYYGSLITKLLHTSDITDWEQEEKKQ
jgi:hypothetical protein